VWEGQVRRRRRPELVGEELVLRCCCWRRFCRRWRQWWSRSGAGGRSSGIGRAELLFGRLMRRCSRSGRARGEDVMSVMPVHALGSAIGAGLARGRGEPAGKGSWARAWGGCERGGVPGGGCGGGCGQTRDGGCDPRRRRVFPRGDVVAMWCWW
jgi:hypothetical protein